MYRSVYLLFLAVLLTSLPSCTALKVSKALSQGSLDANPFVAVFDYEDRVGLLVIPVEINGQSKRFLIDTGAPNVVSKELADALGLIISFETKVGDSQGSSSKLGFAEIASIKIGDLEFKNTFAVVADLQQSTEVACLGVDGFIGANLMRRAVWQFNFREKKIRIANSLDSLPPSETALEVPFNPSTQGTPEIAVKLMNQKVSNVVVDLGSNGDIDVPRALVHKLRPVLKNKTYKGMGSSGSGLYGRVEDTTYVALVDSTYLGGQFVGAQIVEFEGAGGRNIGTDFFKDYLLTIDWTKGRLFLDPQPEKQQVLFATLGFGAILDKTRLKVGYLIEGAPAAEAGLKLGDRIMFMNGLDFINVNQDKYCKLFLEEQIDDRWDRVDMVVEQDGRTKKFTIRRVKLLPGK